MEKTRTVFYPGERYYHQIPSTCENFHLSSIRGEVSTLIPMWHDIKIQAQNSGKRAPGTFVCLPQATAAVPSSLCCFEVLGKNEHWKEEWHMKRTQFFKLWETIDLSNQYIQ